MQAINYITDNQGNKTGLVFNFSDNFETKILNFWLNLTNEKRNLINLYIAKFMREIATDKKEKSDLNALVNDIEGITHRASNTVNEPSAEYVAYTTKGKGLTQKEYSDIILKASDDAHAGIGLVPHEEVVNWINSLIEENENNLAS